MASNFDIKGKIALVTGGANGIGLAYVKELLKNGLKVIHFWLYLNFLFCSKNIIKVFSQRSQICFSYFL